MTSLGKTHGILAIAEATGLPHLTSLQSLIGQVDSHSDPFLFVRSGNALIVGGNWNNGANAGLSYLNNDNDGGNSNNGSRLNEPDHSPKFIVISTSPECETVKQNQFRLVSCAGMHGETVGHGLKDKAFSMKRIGNLWSKVTSIENLEVAAKKACSSRKNMEEVLQFLENRDSNLRRLQNSLIYHTYETSEYRIFEKNENGKNRLVSDLPLYPDRIAHWAVALVVEPYIQRRLIPQTHASRKGHGTHTAIADVQKYIQNDARIRYALQVDVRKCFPSMPKTVAKEAVRRVIKDPDVLWFIDKIVDDYELPGIPLGNRLSPDIANLVLSYAVDHPMKEIHHCHYYVRYMDDILILGYSKPWLHKMRRIMAAQFEEYGLTMKENWQVYPIDDRGIDFVGYRIYRNKVLLRTRTKKKMKRACANLQILVDEGYSLNRSQQGTVWSYYGILKWCDSRGLKKVTVSPLIRSVENDKRLARGLRAWCDYIALVEKRVI
mgnify:CR=1 FL=1